ncbi:MAG: FAD-linked oxidase C-terminal domain-containing protein [Desulfomonilaceae bacterium]|nr:FAD-linked oxidase C-terminal domain-containing protein [Desulfomonilaceae bacterium]
MRSDVKSELIRIVGAQRATDRPEDRVAYSYDAYTREHLPDIVLFPLTTREVSAVMKTAFRESVPVTARGSATNLAGEAVPLRGGIVLALSRMDRILSIDAENFRAVVQPGVINHDFQTAVGRLGLLYPPDPSSWMVCSMGGNVCTNAGGPKTVKYGVTRDYLIGLTVVLANGEVLDVRETHFRNGSGYNLTHLFCGSEGTLGIITEITVRLVAKPKATRTLRADFPNLEDSGKAVADIIGSGIVPSALELLDDVVISAVEADAHLGLPPDVEGILLVEVDGEPESLDPQVNRIENVLTANHAVRVIAAKDDAEAQSLWTARRAAFSVMSRLRPTVVMEDATVPVSNLPAMIRKVRESANRHGVRIGVVAHAGDGNLHPLVVFDKRDEEEVERVQRATEEIYREALALGGTLSGEHGIGISKAGLLTLQLDPVAMAVTRAIKQGLDPKGILNPGKFI